MGEKVQRGALTKWLESCVLASSVALTLREWLFGLQLENLLWDCVAKEEFKTALLL